MSLSMATVKLNRLAYERSPYLLQHASNPVDWYFAFLHITLYLEQLKIRRTIA